MGQAKVRKKMDPLFGKVPQQRQTRGIVLTSPFRISGADVRVPAHALDPVELRYALLFWDKVAWPENNIIAFETPSEIRALMDMGVLIRPRSELTGRGAGGAALLQTQMQSFEKLEAAAPGCWSMSQSDETFAVLADRPQTRSLLVTLTQAVPIPAGDVPFEEILNFKQRRLPELYRFRAEVEELYTRVISSADKALAFRQASERIEGACVDLIKVNKEWSFRSLLSSIDWSLKINGSDVYTGIGTAAAALHNLDAITSLGIGAAASTISASVRLARNVAAKTQSPYRYVAKAHHELKF